MTVSEFLSLWEIYSDRTNPGADLSLAFLNSIEEKIYEFVTNAYQNKYSERYYINVTAGGSLENVSITSGGTGYVVSETLTMGDATLTITSVSGGVVTGVEITDSGSNLTETTTYDVTGGSGSGCQIKAESVVAYYSLPSDFQHIRFRKTGLYDVTGTTKYREGEYHSASDSFSFEDVDGTTKLAIYPTPTQGKTYLLRYIPYRTQLTSVGDTLMLDDRYGKMLYLRHFSMYMESRDGEYIDASVSQQFTEEEKSFIYRQFKVSSKPMNIPNT